MSVSTVASREAGAFDQHESYNIYRQPFPFERANRFTNQLRWARWLTSSRSPDFDVLHCGNIRPVGYAVRWANRKLGVPYLVYVNGGDLLRERRKSARSAVKRKTAQSIFGHASGIVATSKWVAQLASEVMAEVGIEEPPPVAALDLGTDPANFNPSRDTGALRRRWGVGDAPIILTVARLVPHKGQDMGIRALAMLTRDFPELRYIMVGEGHDELRLRGLARELGVSDKVGFVGPMRDDELPRWSSLGGARWRDRHHRPADRRRRHRRRDSCAAAEPGAAKANGPRRASRGRDPLQLGSCRQGHA